jgi:hypothetical protein
VLFDLCGAKLCLTLHVGPVCVFYTPKKEKRPNVHFERKRKKKKITV